MKSEQIDSNPCVAGLFISVSDNKVIIKTGRGELIHLKGNEILV